MRTLALADALDEKDLCRRVLRIGLDARRCAGDDLAHDLDDLRCVHEWRTAELGHSIGEGKAVGRPEGRLGDLAERVAFEGARDPACAQVSVSVG
jgi:hypothetical protein